ncbi:methyltransferase domain-containing protein [Seongchinamella sediminis]|uniref:Methyltransferase domain-containing protein n=1 Tax=Seongchinamella sediminis TaxID=2283635 RepID=A0A3L7E1T7_9GAMM|nr:class I SAM-dependent methyltransferase [Seongchinamella sediminis]RLQ22949.1 methyltransferase domain-containing protein [Seongchinamella sediminis]
MAASAPVRLDCPQGCFELRRYPGRKQEPLQAWTSADLLLLEAAQGDSGPCLVANDEHGALSTALAPAALWTDSALAAAATASNCRRNGITAPVIIWSTGPPSGPFDRVFMRVPKSLPYFEYQLARLNAALPAGSRLHCAGMDKHLSPQTGDIMEQYCDQVQRHRGQRKARLFTALTSGRPAPATPALRGYYCEPAGGELTALPNVFSGDRLDIGSRFLLQHLKQLGPAGHAADLACGNGVLGIAALRQGIASSMLFADESAMAIASARANCARLLPGAEPVFHHGDGLLACADRFDLVLCNPPFHLGHTVDDYAGKRLLQQAAARLRTAGSLLLVANRHLHYGPGLRRRFRQVERLAQNNKFIIWRAAGAC